MGKPQKLQRLLATCADAPEHLPYRAALQSRSHTHCKIYDKRWGSLIVAMELAQEIEGPLRAVWDMDKFLFGGGNPKNARELDLKLFDEAVSIVSSSGAIALSSQRLLTLYRTSLIGQSHVHVTVTV